MPGLLCRAEVTKVERLGVVEPAEQPAEEMQRGVRRGCGGGAEGCGGGTEGC
jgi:hypothetical protein